MAGEDDVSPENSAKLPALRPQGTELSVVRPGSKLVSRIAGDAYRHLPSPTEKLWRVGDYEVNEQSYRQIMLWVDQLRAAGNDIDLERFIEIQDRSWINKNFIEKVNFNYQELLNFILKFEEIDISNAPKLIELRCDFSGLSELDLSLVPSLIRLDCAGNKLTELDLSCVANLSELECYGNLLTDIDLSNLSNLTVLDCRKNQIEQLDLSHLPNLMMLDCRDNRLIEIDIQGCSSSQFWLDCEPYVSVRHRPDQTVVRTSSQ